MKLKERIDILVEPFSVLKKEFSQNEQKWIYNAIDNIGQLIGGFYMLSWEISKVEDKYGIYARTIAKDVEKVEQCVKILQKTTGRYLDYDYYCKINEEREILEDNNKKAIENVYKIIMKKIGGEFDEEENLKKAVKYSPYIYLQAIYCYQGAPVSKETLLAIDEAQGIAPEEIKLLNNINGGTAVFNMFGDIYQHIEGTKGIDSWDEYKEILDYNLYEMHENYRNASQITEYCNRMFNMKMIAINTPGKGVHELRTETEFESEMITQLMDNQRTGLAAILVSNDIETEYLLKKFTVCSQKFHDMTKSDFSIHRTKWNIINIDDAKGLEFSSVIVLSGRMSKNQRYIAFTRALDDLYVYPEIIDSIKNTETGNKTPDFMEKTNEIFAKKENKAEPTGNEKSYNLAEKHEETKIKKDYANSVVRQFFEDRGLEVYDNREQGGRLWVIGEKAEIKQIIDEAIDKFNISGKYMVGATTKNKNSWCTKTDK